MPETDPKLDLVLQRTVDVPPGLVWKCWTEPEHLMPWFCPKPWRTTECEIDLRPGGRFRTVMQGPEGERFDNVGCYLEVVKDRKLVWTSALLPGYRPAPPGGPLDFPFTAILLLEPAGAGTKYTAIALHKEEAHAKQHADMGFQDGWGTVVDQLVAYIKTM
jgi:uncharacterized protein YndB with AHSA1/START domain